MLPSGFEARLAVFGQALDALLGQPSMAALARVEQAASQVLHHDLGDRPGTRVERVQMALRLARWLVAAQATGARAPTKASPGPGLPTWHSAMPRMAPMWIGRGSSCWGGMNWPRCPRPTGCWPRGCGSGAKPSISGLPRRSRPGTSNPPRPRIACRSSRCWSTPGPLARQAPVLFLVVDGLSLPVFRESVRTWCAPAGWSRSPRSSQRPGRHRGPADGHRDQPGEPAGRATDRRGGTPGKDGLRRPWGPAGGVQVGGQTHPVPQGRTR